MDASLASIIGVWSRQVKEGPPSQDDELVSSASVAPLSAQWRAGCRKSGTFPTHEHDGLQQSQYLVAKPSCQGHTPGGVEGGRGTSGGEG